MIEDKNPPYDRVDHWMGRALDFLAGMGFLALCIAAGTFFGSAS